MENVNVELRSIPQVKLSFTDADSKYRPQAGCSRDVVDIVKPFFADCMQHHEEMHALLMDNRNRVLGVLHLGTGSRKAVTINDMALYQALILSNASGCALAHNHPSSYLLPSQQDDIMTNNTKQALELLGFKLLDHIILTADSYYSYADEGRL